MSKQQGYQQHGTEVPNAQFEDYGVATRLPHAGVSCPTHGGAYHGNFGMNTLNCTCGAAGVAAPMAYPAAAYAAAAAWAGYPVTSPVPMAGPLGMDVQDPLGLGRCARKRARRMACAAYGCHECRGCRRGCHRRRGGPVHLLFSLARSALQFA